MYGLCTTFEPGAYGDQKRMSDPLELALRMAVKQYVRAENQDSLEE